MAASRDGEPIPEDAWPGQQSPSDLTAWYALGNERIGRHGATAPDLNETVLLPPLRDVPEPGRARPQMDLRPAGRHASAQTSDDGQPTTDDLTPGPDTTTGPVAAAASRHSPAAAVNGKPAA